MTDATPLHCRHSMHACVISRNIIVNLYLPSPSLGCYLLSCIAHGAPSCECLLFSLTQMPNGVMELSAASWLEIRASWMHTHRGVSAFPRHMSDATPSRALPLLDVA